MWGVCCEDVIVLCVKCKVEMKNLLYFLEMLCVCVYVCMCACVWVWGVVGMCIMYIHVYLYVVHDK